MDSVLFTMCMYRKLAGIASRRNSDWLLTGTRAHLPYRHMVGPTTIFTLLLLSGGGQATRSDGCMQDPRLGALTDTATNPPTAPSYVFDTGQTGSDQQQL